MNQQVQEKLRKYGMSFFHELQLHVIVRSIYVWRNSHALMGGYSAMVLHNVKMGKMK